MSVGSAPHIPQSELNANDVDTSVEEMYVAPTGTWLAGGRHNGQL
jgi:hypothetical protein